MKLLTLFSISLLLISGCATPPPTPWLPDAPPTPDQQLSHARTLLETGNARAALSLYADVRDHAPDSATRQRAILGLSAALRATGDTSAAIGALTPIPATVRTELDARQYAMLGELYIRLNATETAASYLEQSLTHKPDTPASWRAAAQFNLGKCALALERPAAARAHFTQAKADYEVLSDTLAANRCAAVLADLESF